MTRFGPELINYTTKYPITLIFIWKMWLLLFKRPYNSYLIQKFLRPLHHQCHIFYWTRYLCFKGFVTGKMLQETAEQTNVYSVQKEGKSLNATSIEIEQRVCTHTWGWSRCPVCKPLWCDVLRSIQEVADTDSLSGRPQSIWWCERDKLENHAVVTKNVHQFLSISEECHAVDELMVPFKGKTHLCI